MTAPDAADNPPGRMAGDRFLPVTAVIRGKLQKIMRDGEQFQRYIHGMAG